MTLCLEKMLEIKEKIPKEAIAIKGEENVGQIVEYYGLNEKQRQMLETLFALD